MPRWDTFATDDQKRYIKAVHEFRRERGYGPTQGELMRMVGRSKSAVVLMCHRLREKGYIAYEDHRWWSMTVLPEGLEAIKNVEAGDDSKQ